VFSFERNDTDLPAEVLDTSFVVEALIGSQRHHDVALEFLVRLADEGVRIRFSSMLELELVETAFQLALKENHPRDWRRYRHDGRARRRASRLMAQTSTAWRSVLAELEHRSVPIEDVIAAVPRLMSAYGLASYDAVHAATALLPDPVPLVTTDVGFCALPQTTSILTDESRVQRCRQLRAARPV
jgi:predicted nucleic acid-binding protein